LEDEIFASLSIDYLRPENAPSHDDDRMRIVGTKEFHISVLAQHN